MEIVYIFCGVAHVGILHYFSMFSSYASIQVNEYYRLVPLYLFCVHAKPLVFCDHNDNSRNRSISLALGFYSIRLHLNCTPCQQRIFWSFQNDATHRDLWLIHRILSPFQKSILYQVYSVSMHSSCFWQPNSIRSHQ